MAELQKNVTDLLALKSKLRSGSQYYTELRDFICENFTLRKGTLHPTSRIVENQIVFAERLREIAGEKELQLQQEVDKLEQQLIECQGEMDQIKRLFSLKSTANLAEAVKKYLAQNEEDMKLYANETQRLKNKLQKCSTEQDWQNDQKAAEAEQLIRRLRQENFQLQQDVLQLRSIANIDDFSQPTTYTASPIHDNQSKEITKLSQMISELQDRLCEYEFGSQQAQFKVLQMEYNQLQEKHSILQHEARTTQVLLEEQSEELEKLRQITAQQKQKISEQNIQLKQYQDQLDGLSSATQEQTIKALKLNNAQMALELERVRSRTVPKPQKKQINQESATPQHELVYEEEEALREQQIMIMNQQLKNSVSKINTLETQLEALRTVQDQVKQKEDRVNQLNEVLATKEAEIEELKQKLSDSAHYADQMKVASPISNDKAAERYERLQRQFDKLKALRDEAEKKAEQRGQMIAFLHAQLKNQATSK